MISMRSLDPTGPIKNFEVVSSLKVGNAPVLPGILGRTTRQVNGAPGIYYAATRCRLHPRDVAEWFGPRKKEARAAMCRNIRTLFNFEPPATDKEIRASAVQFVRKISGFTHPSKSNEAAFERAVEDVTLAARRLVDSLVTSAAPRNREAVAARARARAAKRFAAAGG